MIRVQSGWGLCDGRWVLWGLCTLTPIGFACPSAVTPKIPKPKSKYSWGFQSPWFAQTLRWARLPPALKLRVRLLVPKGSVPQFALPQLNGWFSASEVLRLGARYLDLESARGE